MSELATDEGGRHTALGELPKSWDVVPLGSVARMITSGSRGWARFYADRGAVFLRIGNLTREHINLRLRNVQHVKPPEGAEGQRTCVKHNDLLISVTADLGIIGVIPLGLGEAYVNQHIALVRLDEENVNPRWIGAYLSTGAGQNQFTRLNDQGAKAGLNLPAVGSLLVAKPLRREQDRMAEILDTADEAIRGTEALVGKLKAMKAGLLDDLLTRGLDEHGHLRDPATHPEQFKDSFLGRIPLSWKVEPLQQITAYHITYGIVQAGPHMPGGIPYIRTGDMAGDRLVIDRMLRTSHQIASAYRRSEVRAGEIVCAIRATVGKVLEVPPELDGANLTQGTARIAPVRNVNSHFLLWALRSPRVQQQFDLAIKGTTFSEITLEKLREIPVPVPQTRGEQDRIAEALDAHDARIRAEEAYLEKLKLQKKGLMHDLLTGRVRVGTR